MPQILLCCEYPTLNGGERSMLAVLPHLLKQGLQFRALTPPSGPLAEALESFHIEVLPLELFHRSVDSSGATGCSPAGAENAERLADQRLSQEEIRVHLSQVIGDNRPALLHANSLSMGRLLGPVAKQFQVPSIAHLRDILRLSTGAVADLNCNTRLLAVSRATRDYHVAAGLSPEKTKVLYNGVDLQKFYPRPATGYLHDQLNLPPESKLIGSIGQIGPRKGLDVLLQAANQVVAKVPEAHFLVIGSRHSEKDESIRFESDLHAAAQSNSLAGHVHFLGTRDDVNQLLCELTLLVHAARQEPLGRVLLEAAASGCAIVATSVGGTEEIFPQQSNAACLIEPEDPDALAQAIINILGDEPLRNELGRAARRRAEAAFDVKLAAASLAEHYRELIQ